MFSRSSQILVIEGGIKCAGNEILGSPERFWNKIADKLFNPYEEQADPERPLYWLRWRIDSQDSIRIISFTIPVKKAYRQNAMVCRYAFWLCSGKVKYEIPTRPKAWHSAFYALRILQKCLCNSNLQGNPVSIFWEQGIFAWWRNAANTLCCTIAQRRIPRSR